MNLPFDYDRMAVGEFGGTTPTTTDFEHARVVILPIPLDRTTSYVAGTRSGPHHGVIARDGGLASWSPIPSDLNNASLAGTAF